MKLISISAYLLFVCFTQHIVAQGKNPTLKNIFKNSFLIGAAVNEAQFSGSNKQVTKLITTQFNSITPENVLKWERVHPQPGQYTFEVPDKYVEFGLKNKLFTIGHTLIWHAQTPKWVFEDGSGKPLEREALLARMKDHIYTVMGRYKGKIKGWDVVNEALNEDGSLRQTKWYKIIGPDYIEQAFRFAHEADPGAELYYNDYSVENIPKRNGVIELVKKLQSKGIMINGVGLQGHYKMDWPSAGLVDSTIEEISQLGVKIMITELDLDVLPVSTANQGADVSLNVEMQAKLNPYTKGLPDSVDKSEQKRYIDLFGTFIKHSDKVSRVTFWGVTDANSWLNNWPVRGRTSYPLLFDRNGQPKPVFYALVQAAKNLLKKSKR